MNVIQERLVAPIVVKSPRQEKLQSHYSLLNERILCCYLNSSAQFQIVRIVGCTDDFFERTVMPHTKLFFEARPDDYLEIHTGTLISSILSDKIPCHRLASQEDYDR